MTSSLSAVAGEANTLRLPKVDRAVAILVDGLGANALHARAGHARYLALRLTKPNTMTAGFPTTTASALATMCTGVPAGQHGIVGYNGFDPATGAVFNHLSGWKGAPDPVAWQPCQTVFERATASSVRAYAVGPERYRTTSYTRAVLRGADYVGARSVQKRFDVARQILDHGGRSIVYLYVPELDVAAHRHGWQSEAWSARLDELDAAVFGFTRLLKAQEGAVLTADHGVVDVPEHAHVLYNSRPELLQGVRAVAGDPRCLQLHIRAGEDATAVAERWQQAEGERAWIATRDEAIAAGWFGAVADSVAPRIGDVMIAARSRVAYYNAATATEEAQRMIGQHGSLDPDELKVPLIGLGAFE